MEWQEMIHEVSEIWPEGQEWIHGWHRGMDGREIGSEIVKDQGVEVLLKRIKYRNRRLLNMVVVSCMVGISIVINMCV